MNWITDNIAIGNFADAQDADILRRGSIQSVLGLIDTLRGVEASTLGVKEIEIVPLVDGEGNDYRLFEQAVTILARLVREAAPVLVHCHAGRSRSAVVVAAYLMNAEGIEAEVALARVAARREIAVSAELLDLLGRLR